jgi:hypothetical protein
MDYGLLFGSRQFWFTSYDRLRDTFLLLSTLYITEEHESMKGTPAYSIFFSSHLRSLLRSHGSFVDM